MARHFYGINDPRADPAGIGDDDDEEPEGVDEDADYEAAEEERLQREERMNRICDEGEGY